MWVVNTLSRTWAHHFHLNIFFSPQQHKHIHTKKSCRFSSYSEHCLVKEVKKYFFSWISTVKNIILTFFQQQNRKKWMIENIMNACVHVHVCTYRLMCACLFVRVWMCVWVPKYMFMCMFVCMCAYVNAVFSWWRSKRDNLNEGSHHLSCLRKFSRFAAP